MQKPLDGLVVLDLSRVLAGPWASQCLADLGARVIKIERVAGGDDTRAWGPPYMAAGGAAREEVKGEAAYYLSANRGKQSVALNIATEEGQKMVRALAAGADVVIENYRCGSLRKYGLDYDSLKVVKPDLVYCSITGFGQTGPYKDRPGYDFVIQGMSGLMSVTGPDAETPTKVGVAMADLSTGLYSVIAILSALLERTKTGRGKHIDMALLDVMLGLLANQNMNYLLTGRAPRPMGNSHPNIVPYQVFDTKDGQIVLAVGNDGQFRQFCDFAGRPDLAEDPRFATNEARVTNRAHVVSVLEEVVREKTAGEWVSGLVVRGVPAGPIYDLAAAFEDPHVKARGMVFELPHGCGQMVPQVRTPIKMDGEDVTSVQAPPLHGADTREILREIGLSETQIAALVEKGIVGGL